MYKYAMGLMRDLVTGREPVHSDIRPVLVLVICCASMFVVSLDSSIVNVALPSMGRDLASDSGSVSWIVDAYTLTLAGLLISSGILADRFGRVRCFRYGLAVFGAGSLLCSVAPDFLLLICGRVVQGVGGSMLNPVALAIIGSVFTDKARRARALGAWGAVLGVAMALGPVSGGLLTDAFGWRAIFWINIPVCVVAVWATTRYVPESFGTRGRRLDLLGQFCFAGTMFVSVLGIVEFPRLGVRSALGWSIVALFAGCVVVTVVAVRRSAEPFIDPRYFADAAFSTANLCGLVASGGQGVLVFTLSTYLQLDLHQTPSMAGLRLIPVAVGTFVFSSISGRAVARFGVEAPLGVGGILVVGSGVALLMFGAGPLVPVVVAAGLFGAGFGLANAPITATAVVGMGADSGAASGVVSTSRQLGMSIGVAFAGAVSGFEQRGAPLDWVALAVCGAVIVAGSGVLFLEKSRRTPAG
jgi:EmrB/QacA subfamily drug resistance transporter